MEGKSTAKPLADANLTERELRHLAAAWLSCPSKDNIDFDLFTILTGHPNSTNARKRFGEIKKRVREQIFGTGAGCPAPITTSPRKRKTNGSSDSASPTKKNKATKGKTTEPKVPEDDVKAEDVDA